MGTTDENESSLLHDLTGLQDPRSLASFLEVAFDAVVPFDLQGRVTSWNRAAEKMFGWTAQEALGKTPAELFWPADVPIKNESRQQRQARLMQGETLKGEITPCRRDGSSFPVQFTARAIFDSDGKASGYLAVYRDISDRVQMRAKEEQLRQSNQRLNQILSSIQDDFYVLNRDWLFVFASRTFTSRIGKEPEDFVGNNIWEMFPKHVGGVLYENFHIAMEKREIRRFEIPGRYTNAWYRMNVFPSEEGITVIGTDISDRKQSEQDLQENQATLQSFYDSAPFMMGIVELDGDRSVLVSGNRTLADFFAVQLADMIGHPSSELGTPLAIERLWVGNYRKSQAQRSPVSFEYEYPHPGAGHWFQATVSFITTGPSGRPRFCFVTENITGRKRAEQALAQAMQELHAHLDNSPLAIITFDREYRIMEWSAGAERMFGWCAEEMLGKRIAEVRWVYEEDAQRVATLSVDMMTGRMSSNVNTNRNYCKDGSVIDCEWYNSALLDADGQLISVRSQVLNITKRKQAEDALRESERQLHLLNESLEQKVQEKTAEVRRLAADLVIAVQRERHRISHILHDDLQQRIYAIQMQLTFLHHELEKVHETAHREAAEIEKQLTDVLNITRNLSIDLSPPILRDEGLSQAISWLAGQMRQRYGLPIEIQADGPFIVPDEELQVLLFNCVRELLFNVVKHAEASRAVVALQWLEDSLRIEVRDDGKGFPVKEEEQPSDEEVSEEENLQVSFGLPTLRHQLSLFDGHMEILSEPGAGTQVFLVIPMVQTG